MKGYLLLPLILALSSCNSKSGGSVSGPTINYGLSLEFTRIDQPGLDPFKVTATLSQNGTPINGKTIYLTVPKGTVSAFTDNGDGTYDFTVTPISTGIHPVTVNAEGVSLRRDAIVTTEFGSGVGQPLLVPGLVNSDGYEDGITISPDGEYLFIQYGPVYFSGIFYHSAICAEAGWSMYDLNTCYPKDDSNLVFDTVGPYNTASRPNFPDDAISGGQLTHLNITVPGVANKIVLFPTVFYGFKRQTDGTFAQPFKLAFNDAKGTNGPFGLSFQMTGTNTAKFIVSWNDYFNNLGDDGADIYHGTVTMNQNNSLGDVVYSGDFYQSITPTISPVNLPSHSGNQGNPHLYYDNSGTIQSIWTDDEKTSHNLTVYTLSAGTFPSGTWTATSLAPKINTGASESQPFYTGTRLYLNRNTTIVYHDYLGGDFSQDSSWSNQVVLLKSTDTAIGGVYGFGEPTIATRNGRTYLYFAYVESRAAGESAGRVDFDLGAGYVEIP